ncbi:MAG TPA: hypothetical protein DCW95_09060 [Chryseobacterium sp.]|nr:hypothetical protein [Chryseobacterium sp.]
MKFNTLKITAVALLSTLVTSCAQRLTGTWTVQRYETVTPGQQGVSLQNIGTMKFKNYGTGEKDLDYTVLGLTRAEHAPFKWTWNDGKYVSITGDDSVFSKTWIIIENKRNHQKWKSTDGTNHIQILELRK